MKSATWNVNSVRARLAQSLARHSDIRLTMGIYTHIGLNDQSSAIELLPVPPELRLGAKVAAEAEKRSLDALWAGLPEHVKAGLLATVKVEG